MIWGAARHSKDFERGVANEDTVTVRKKRMSRRPLRMFSLRWLKRQREGGETLKKIQLRIEPWNQSCFTRCGRRKESAASSSMSARPMLKSRATFSLVHPIGCKASTAGP